MYKGEIYIGSVLLDDNILITDLETEYNIHRLKTIHMKFNSSTLIDYYRLYANLIIKIYCDDHLWVLNIFLKEIIFDMNGSDQISYTIKGIIESDDYETQIQTDYFAIESH